MLCRGVTAAPLGNTGTSTTTPRSGSGQVARSACKLRPVLTPGRSRPVRGHLAPGTEEILRATTAPPSMSASPALGDHQKGGSAMAKLHARPSNQYRYEHYDPRLYGGLAG